MMKRIFTILGLLLLVYVLYTCVSTGLFRTIKYAFDGNILKQIDIAGAEDMQISYEDQFILISADDRAARRDKKPTQGHLYYIDLKSELLKPIQLTTNFKETFYPHGISMIKVDSQKYRVYAINHPTNQDHSIEVFDLYNDSLAHIQTLEHPAMISPNDIVALEDGRFYFSNDHAYKHGIGKVIEEYLGRAISSVYYFDGTDYRQVADRIAYANGINYDQKNKRLFVASPRGFLVNVYQVEHNGDLTYIEKIDCGTGVDNIEFDADGKIWIGCHPSLLTFNAYSKGFLSKAPSEIITIDYKSKGNYNIESVYLENGENMSAATVACPYNDLIFVGNVMDDHFLVLERD